MDFFEVLEARRSVRAYKADPVPEDKLQRVLRAAQLAPTACNLQPWRLVVLETAGREQELRRVFGGAWLAQAPLVLCVASQPGVAWKRSDGKSYADVDAAIVADHVILAAAAQGLGTCWIGAFRPAAARELFGLLPDEEPVALTPLGIPAVSHKARPRQPLETLVRRR